MLFHDNLNSKTNLSRATSFFEFDFEQFTFPCWIIHAFDNALRDIVQQDIRDCVRRNIDRLNTPNQSHSTLNPKMLKRDTQQSHNLEGNTCMCVNWNMAMNECVCVNTHV